jgi:hypothetical protein
MEKSCQLHLTAALSPGKEPPVPIEPQSRSGFYGEEKNLTPAGNRTPAVQPIAILTGLSRQKSNLCINNCPRFERKIALLFRFVRALKMNRTKAHCIKHVEIELTHLSVPIKN